jgi:NAD(P) transhydrogenase subunit alpha
MQIFVPREADTEEVRVPLIPPSVEKLAAAGAEVRVEAGLGASLGIPDETYREKGAHLVTDRIGALGAADLVLRLLPPPHQEAGAMKRGCIHISHLDPFGDLERVHLLAKAGVSAISVELIPRSTIAQKMDALSSQANLAGYEAVIVAAERLRKILPMMSTPSGTIAPARVFVIGAGVAGLQAIATAKRLGAIVEAFDTRPVVEEQVKSLGARFVKIDLGETGQTKDGYAKALTDEQLALQREAMTRHCAGADIVITTAKLFGRPAPRIITEAMIRAMKPGSVVVDLAAETGGNVEGSELEKEVEVQGVRIIGIGKLERRAAVDASLMYSNNLVHLVEHIWDKETKQAVLDREDELVRGCLVTFGGEVVHEQILAHATKKD